jgi:hypothetical protein
VTKTHLLLNVPPGWTNDRKGEFFEEFVGDVLRPMRFKVIERVRCTGMEIDLLAKGVDQPKTVLVECKAQREHITSEVISKLLGNVDIYGADSGWLFATSDLGKEGRGSWEQIQAQPRLASRFSWFSPSTICEILVDQRVVSAPTTLVSQIQSFEPGDATLVVQPGRWSWLIEILDHGLPAYVTVFDAKSGHPLRPDIADEVIRLSPRLASLEYYEVSTPPHAQVWSDPTRASVARVIPGDTWDDLRPSRPEDFVGRDDLLEDISEFFDQVRHGSSSTRTFAIQGPSGWGKSSLVLKLADLARQGRISRCSITAVDSRSAGTTAFVSAAVLQAFNDGLSSGIIDIEEDLTVDSLQYPLDSSFVARATESLSRSEAIIVLIFDQFEELFSKEDLFETFHAVRDLSLELDARQIPVILGFSWKSDVTFSHDHPAYYLWQSLSDRRRSYYIRQFGRSDIQKIIRMSLRESGTRLTPPIQDRLVEQCQGLPWLLKKLIVHIQRRLPMAMSQYDPLERQLDIQMLFDEDLASLSGEQIRCLEFVARNSPISVTDLESDFSNEVTSGLVNSRLLVRSGRNYVVYWDIFRDYLTDKRVPDIPWARTFQRDPPSAMNALRELALLKEATTAELAATIGFKNRPCMNLLSDLVALQLVDRVAEDLYRPATHLETISLGVVADHARRQLQRHVVVQRIERDWERGTEKTHEEWIAFFDTAQPRTAQWSAQTLRFYGANLRRWLVFSGLLDERGQRLTHPLSTGGRMGIVQSRRSAGGVFLGSSTPRAVLRLLRVVNSQAKDTTQEALARSGLRNAVTDALALGLVSRDDDGRVVPGRHFESELDMSKALEAAILCQDTISALIPYWERRWSDAVVGDHLRQILRSNHWKPVQHGGTRLDFDDSMNGQRHPV